MSENFEKLKICQICQSLGNHSTRTCPSLICAECDEKGHAKKDCPYLLPPKIENGTKMEIVKPSSDTEICQKEGVQQSSHEKYSLILERARQLGSEYENDKSKKLKPEENYTKRKSSVRELKQMLRRPHAKCGTKNLLSCKRTKTDKGEDDKSSKSDQLRFRPKRIVGPKINRISQTQTTSHLIKQMQDLQNAANLLILMIIGQTILNNEHRT